MKKVFILVVIYSCVLTHSFGQINWGYKAGVNNSIIFNSSHNDFTSNTKFNTGVISKIKLVKEYFLNLECLYSIKGYNTELIPSGKNTINLSYLTLPILIELRTTNKFYFQFGTELNYLVAAKIKDNTNEGSVLDKYNKFDISIAGGICYYISKKLGLETRYVFGLSQINQRPDIFGSEYNRTFQVNLIYLFK